jgi:cytochrome c oxidase cbb3-type subunit 3
MNLRATPCAIGIATLVVFSLLYACGRSPVGNTAPRDTIALPSTTMVAAVPLGQLAGAPYSVAALSTPSPDHANPQAIEQGKQLYIQMNCAGCHAYNGKGNMGPDLTDTEWRYGGLPVQIYQSIFDGRPQGMPSWGAALPPAEIWKLVAYIQSFGGSVSVSDYAHARQGDQPGEQVAPEAQTEAQLGATPVPLVEQYPQTTTPPKSGKP